MPAPRCSRGRATRGYRRRQGRHRSAADASGAQNDVGFRDVLAQARTTHGLFVPLAFGFVDRLTAGFFALVGVYYFQDPETFGLSAGAAERRSRSSSSPSRCCRPRSARFRTEGALPPRRARVDRVRDRHYRRRCGAGLPVAAALMVLCRCLRRADGAGDDGARHGSGSSRRPAARRWDCSTCSARSGSSPASSSAGAPPICSATRPFLAVGGLELAIALALFPAVRSIAPGDGLPRTRRRDWAVALGVTLPPPDMRWCGRPSRAL